MSTVYATEPSPSGRIVLETTHGPLDMELWCRECPLTTQWILQLVLDGFLENVVFHRILPNTLIQTGAIRYHAGNTTTPATTTKTTESSHQQQQQKWSEYRALVQADRALERRRWELNSRLRFSHRGLVALALPLDDETNHDNNNRNDDNNDELSQEQQQLQPQFFITLEETPYLDGKHVIFGRITGPTIFNALRMGRLGTTEEGDDNSVVYSELPRILHAKIVENTIHTHLKPTPPKHVPWNATTTGDEDLKKIKKRNRPAGKLDVHVLSFGDEVVEEEQYKKNDRKHNNTGTTSKNDDEQEEEDEQPRRHKKKKKRDDDDYETSREHFRGTKNKESKATIGTLEDAKDSNRDTNSSSNNNNNNNNNNTDNKIETVDTNKQGTTEATAVTTPAANNNAPISKTTHTKQDDSTPKQQQTTLSQKEKKKKKKEKLSGASLLQAMRNQSQFVAAAATRAKASKQQQQQQPHDQVILSKLLAFQSRLGGVQSTSNNNASAAAAAHLDPKDNSLAARMARKALLAKALLEQQQPTQHDKMTESYHGQVLEETAAVDDIRDPSSWMSTRFTCRKHMDLNDGMGGDGRPTDEYQVLDDRNPDKTEQQQQQHTNKEDERQQRRRPPFKDHGRHHHHHERRQQGGHQHNPTKGNGRGHH